MKATHYLYDCDPLEFSELPYKDALEYKRDKADALLHTITYQHYSVRDDERSNAVHKAAKHCRELLKELE